MLKIRLQRTGRKHETTFRIVLTDSKNSTKSGRYKEILGSYDPRKDNATLIKGERVTYWLSVGAEASGTVHNLLLQHKLITGKKINVLPKKTVPKKEEAAVEQEAGTTPSATEAPVAPPESNSEPVTEEKGEESASTDTSSAPTEEAPVATEASESPEAPIAAPTE